MDNWVIIRNFILANEDAFMRYLEDQHEIEGSDMDHILDQVKNKLREEKPLEDASKACLQRLQGLLQETGGYFTVHDNGNSLSLTIPSSWKRPDTAERINALLHSEEAAVMIDVLADGLYDHHAIEEFLGR